MANPALAQLKDIHLPTPIGIWPLAPGWWLIIVLATLLTALISYLSWQRYCRNRAKKRALILLDQFKNNYDNYSSNTQTAAHLSTLLRRVAIAYYPRHDVAGLQGQNWLNFLDSHYKDTHSNQLFSPIANLLLELPYQQKASTDLGPLFLACEKWIKQRGKKQRKPKSNGVKT